MRYIISIVFLFASSQIATAQTSITIAKAEELVKKGKASFIGKDEHREIKIDELSKLINEKTKKNNELSVEYREKLKVEANRKNNKLSNINKQSASQLKKLKFEYEKAIKLLENNKYKRIKNTTDKYAINRENIDNEYLAQKKKNDDYISLYKENILSINKESEIIQKVNSASKGYVTINTLNSAKDYIRRTKTLHGALLNLKYIDSLHLMVYVLEKKYPYSVKHRVKTFVLSLTQKNTKLDFDNIESILNSENIKEIKMITKEFTEAFGRGF